MRERVDVTINKLALDYDLLLIVGPTFPHEVVGFSGGNKYLFPGISGPGDHRHVPLAGRAHHQPVDHRDQVHAGARGRRQGGVDGPGRAQVRQPGRRGQRPRRPLPRHARGGLEAAADALEPDPRRLQGPRRTSSVLSLRAGDVRRALGGRKVRLQAGAGRRRRRRAHHLRAAHPRDLGRARRAHPPDRLPRARLLPEADGALRAASRAACWRTRRTSRGSARYEDGVERPRITVTLATGIGRGECRAVNLGYRDPGRSTRRLAGPRGRRAALRPQGGRDAVPLEERPVHARGFRHERKQSTGSWPSAPTGRSTFSAWARWCTGWIPGIIPFRKATHCDIHVSGGEFNVAANLADCFG